MGIPHRVPILKTRNSTSKTLSDDRVDESILFHISRVVLQMKSNALSAGLPQPQRHGSGRPGMLLEAWGPSLGKLEGLRWSFLKGRATGLMGALGCLGWHWLLQP